ncbi:MAG: TIM-barrel domain-containing protein [Propionicimonas sp.]
MPAAIRDGAEADPLVFIAALEENILRVCITAGRPAPKASSLVLEEYSGAPVQEVDPGATGLGSFVVGRRVPGQDGAFMEIGHHGRGPSLFTVTTARLTPVDLVRYETGGEPPQIETVKTVDGERTFIRNLVPRPDGRAFAAELGFTPLDGEGLYGLGQDEEGGYNRRGTKVNLYQHNMRIPMPCLVSDRGYGILFDSGSLMSFDGTGDQTRLRFNAVEAIDFYLIAGGVDAVVRGFRRLTGRAPMLPKWAFGYVQSKERYSTSVELIDVARRHRELGLPLDCVVQDWKTWSGDQWGQKTVDRERYPDLKALRSALHQLNVHSMVSIWPNMATDCPDQRELAEAGLLLCDYSTYDAFDERARDVYWKQLKAELYGGFDSWWCDSTEPFSAPDWQGSRLRPDDERFEAVGGEHERNLGALRANLYALEHARGIYEHEMAEQRNGAAPVRRVLNLTRSGYPGIQRYGAVLWSGDVSASWTEYRAEITKSISMGLSGVPWWTTDVGAFFVGGTPCWRKWCGDPEAAPVWFWNGDYDDGVANLGYRELYTRWLQFACFLPMFRSHGTDTPREVWNFGSPGQPFYDAIVATIQLRYRLLPYIYSVAADASLNDGVMVRGLVFDFAEDPIARGVHDQFLLGDSVLVCPVTQAAHYGKDGQPLAAAGVPRRTSYLPAGADWWDFWTQQFHRGGRSVETEVPLDRLPIFVRAGSVLPFQGPVSHALENRDVFEVVVYPGADGTGRLFDDDGLTHAYERGEYSLVEFDWSESARRLTLSARSWAREHPLRLRIRLLEQSQEVTFDGTPASITFEERP